jgi:hypothetical protein
MNKNAFALHAGDATDDDVPGAATNHSNPFALVA